MNSGYDDCDDDDDGDCRGKPSKTLKNKRRKRKSYSFAAEMSGFLQSYTERKEKAEEKKIKLLLKCQVFSSLTQRARRGQRKRKSNCC